VALARIYSRATVGEPGRCAACMICHVTFEFSVIFHGVWLAGHRRRLRFGSGAPTRESSDVSRDSSGHDRACDACVHQRRGVVSRIRYDLGHGSTRLPQGTAPRMMHSISSLVRVGHRGRVDQISFLLSVLRLIMRQKP
jgi:hypothetical protein